MTSITVEDVFAEIRQIIYGCFKAALDQHLSSQKIDEELKALLAEDSVGEVFGEEIVNTARPYQKVTPITKGGTYHRGPEDPNQKHPEAGDVHSRPRRQNRADRRKARRDQQKTLRRAQRNGIPHIRPKVTEVNYQTENGIKVKLTGKEAPEMVDLLRSSISRGQQ